MSTRPRPNFPQRFTEFAIAALEVQQSVSGRPPIVCPLNEINFLSWAVEEGYFPRVGPDERGWFKRQLVRTGIAAARRSAALAGRDDRLGRAADHIAPHNRRRRTVRAAERNLQGMYEAYDWIIGLAEPELGGDPSLVDVVGLNFYPHNQWYLRGPDHPDGPPRISSARRHAGRNGGAIRQADLPFRNRRRRVGPAVVAPLRLQRGAGRAWTAAPTVEGICWYPITAYPGLGQSAVMPRPGCCRRSSPTAAAMSTSRCSRNSKLQRALFACRREASRGGGL